MNDRGRAAWSALGLLLILASAAFIHFSVVTRTEVSLPMASDAGDYFSYAYNLKNSGVYSNALSWTPEPPPGGVTPDSLRTPGYALFLLAIPGLDASEAYARRVGRVQATLAVLSVLLVFLVARSVLPPGWPHLAAALTAINPHLAHLSGYLLTEGLFLFLLLLALLVSIRGLRRRDTRLLFAAGVLWGLACLVRPAILFLVPAFLLATVFLPALRAWHLPAAILAAAFVLVQLPWFARNQLTELDHTQGSLMVHSIHHGSYPKFMYQDRPETLGWPFRYDPASIEAEQDLPSVAADILRKFRDRPSAMTRWYLLGKPGTFMAWGYIQGSDIYVYDSPRSPFREDRIFSAIRQLSLLLHWPLMLAGMAGCLLAWWRPRWLGLQGNALLAARIVSGVVLYAIAAHMIAAPFPRYGVPFRPLLTILALLCAASVVDRAWFRRRVPSTAETSSPHA